nr:putative quinol monooxygenase [Sphingomonas sp. Y57]
MTGRGDGISRRGAVAGGLAVAMLGAAPGFAAGPEERMYGLMGRMVAQPGQREALIAILLEGTGAMPGCLAYIVARDLKDADAIWVTEVWDSKQSHAASLELPAVRASIARGKPLIAGFDNYTETEPVGGVGLPHPG